MYRFKKAVTQATGVRSKKIVLFENRLKKPVYEIQILDESETQGLGVRLRDLLLPLFFPIRRGSQDSLDRDDDKDFPGRKGWVSG